MCVKKAALVAARSAATRYSDKYVRRAIRFSLHAIGRHIVCGNHARRSLGITCISQVYQVLVEVVTRRRGNLITKISRQDNMKKTKDVSDEDEYSADDPEEVEGASEEEWIPETGTEVKTHATLYPRLVSLLSINRTWKVTIKHQ